MPRLVKIATTSLATLEDTAPPYNLRYPNPAATLDLGLSLLDAAGAAGVDLAVLPEGFMAAGLPGSQIRAVAEPLDGPSLSAVAERARRYKMYVVAGAYVALPSGNVGNLAVLFDRMGTIVGTYSKRHPTEGEIDNGVEPGRRSAVFETDFGRLGLAVCFDLNWRELWQEMADDHAEIVCWISAYEGGLPLQAYAWTHQYAIVTSVWPYNARVIERTGRIVVQTSRWGRIAFYDLDLDKRLFHTDGQYNKLVPIQTRYGSRVRLETLGEEHMFTLQSLDPTLPIETIISEFGLIEYLPFLDQNAEAQKSARMTVPESVV